MSVTIEEDEPKVLHAFRSQMARIAFADLDHVDLRTALIMAKRDLIRSYDTVQVAAAALAGAEQFIRGESSDVPGPCLLTSDSSSKTRSVDYPAFWILNSDVAARRAAIAYFQELVNRDGVACATKTREAIEKNAVNIVRPTIDEWAESALSVFDAIQDDWDLAVAGLSQCLKWSHVDGINEALPAVLRPRFQSAANACPQIWRHASDLREYCLSAIHTWEGSGAPQLLICKQYLTEMGHLPMTGDVSLSAALQRISHSHTGRLRVLTDLLADGDVNSDPLALYHVYVAILGQEGISDTLRAQAVAWLAVVLPSRDEQRRPPPEMELRHRLASHYLCLLECGTPGVVDDTFAIIAWVLAKKAAKAFEIAAPDVRERIVRAEHDSSDALWKTIRPIAADSILRRTTLSSLSPWAISATAELATALSSEISPDIQPKLEDSLTRIALSLFHKTLDGQSPHVYGMESIATSLSTWQSPLDPTGQRSSLADLTGYIDKLIAENTPIEDLRSLSKTSLSQQVMACHVLQILAERFPALENGLWELMTDADWRKQFFSTAHPRCVEMLGDVLICLQQSHPARWLPESAHFLAGELEGDLPEERIELQVALTMVAALSVGITSPIKRMNAHASENVRKQIDLWTRKLEAMRIVPVPWVVSRLRRFSPALA